MVFGNRPTGTSVTPPTKTIVQVTLLALLAYTNPTMEAYEAFIRQKVIQETRKEDTLTQVLGSLFGGFVSGLIANATTRQDFIFFSLYDTGLGNQHIKVIGLLHNFMVMGLPELGQSNHLNAPTIRKETSTLQQEQATEFGEMQSPKKTGIPQQEGKKDVFAEEHAKNLGSAGTPAIQTGDTYIIESLYPDNPTSNSTTERKVISVDAGKITIASKNLKSKTGKARTIQFTPEWNLISSRNHEGSGVDYSPPLKYFDFPLHPGKTWRQTSIETNIKTGAEREVTLSATVVGDWEDVSVPAGTFRAIRINIQTEHVDHTTGQRITGTDVSWYAPDVRRSVKSAITSRTADGKEERQLIQMIRYDRAGGNG